MDKFSTFRINFCKPTRSLWFKKEENKSSAKEAQTTVKSSQKKQRQLLVRKRQKLLKRMRKKGHKLLLKMQETQVKPMQYLVQQALTKATDSSQMVPEELVGTWTGTTEIAKDVQMIVAADGTVTTTANFYQADLNPVRTATTKAKAVQASGNVYYWETDEPGAFDALLPGIAGLGGANMKVKPGFILEEGHYTPIVFVTGLNEDFDYSKYNDFRVPLQNKEKSTNPLRSHGFQIEDKVILETFLR